MHIDLLPEDILGNILSFVPTKLAASTSILSKKWRNVFALAHNLDFDDSVFLQPEEGKRERDTIRECFREFVHRTLASQCGSPIKKFSLKCYIHWYSEMDFFFSPWIRNAVERGVLEMDVSIKPQAVLFVRGELLANIKKINRQVFLPRELFTSKRLVKLTLGTKIILANLPPHVSLPALKSLFIDSVHFQKEDLCYVLLPGCPVLKNLVVLHKEYIAIPKCISSRTIKILSVHYDCEDEIGINSGMAFDAPSLVFLDYSDFALIKYTPINLESLVEARLDLSYTKKVEYPDVWGLIKGISNVETLHLTPNSVDVISRCRRDGIPLPVFNNLVNLSFGSKNKRSWRLLPYLLEQCPKLETLIIQDLFGHFGDFYSPMNQVKFNNLVNLSFGSRNNRCWKLLPYLLNQSPKLETLSIKDLNGYNGDVYIPLNQVKVLHVLSYRGTAQELVKLRRFLRETKCLELVRVEIAQGVVMDDGKVSQTHRDVLTLLGVSVSYKCKTEVAYFL